MQKFTWIEINVHSNGVVRVYGDGGMIFEAEGENVKQTATIFPKPAPASGEVKAKQPQ